MTKKNTFKRVMALMLVLVCVMSSVSVVGAKEITDRHLRIKPFADYTTKAISLPKCKLLTIDIYKCQVIKSYNNDKPKIYLNVIDESGKVKYWFKPHAYGKNGIVFYIRDLPKGKYKFQFAEQHNFEVVLNVRWCAD